MGSLVGELLVECSPDGVQEVQGVQVHIWLGVLESVYADGKILGHLARKNGFNAGLLERETEVLKLLVAVQLGTMLQTTRPREDGRNGVGGGGVALLVLTVVACHGAVRSLGLDCLAIRAHQHRGHQTQRSWQARKLIYPRGICS